MNIRFKGCNKDLPRSANFECIGNWDALNKHYLAVIDWTNETKPVYKCGVRTVKIMFIVLQTFIDYHFRPTITIIKIRQKSL